MAVPIDSGIQQSLVFAQQGQRFSNVIHWRNTSALTNADEIQNFVDLQDAIFAIWRVVLADAVQFLGSVWTLPEDPTFGSRTTAEVGGFGDQIGGPSQTTQYVIFRRYAFVDERKSRGRTLFAGWPDDFSEDNRITAAAAILLAPVVDSLVDTVAATNTDFVPSNYSGKFGQFFDVFKANLDPVIRSLHARQAAGGL